MMTLNAAHQAIVDVEQRMLRMANITDEGKRQVRDVCSLLRTGIDQIESQACAIFDTLAREIAAANGSPIAETETPESRQSGDEVTERKPKLKMAG